eukprot:1121125-Prymnesium_polylepis.1
MLQARAPGAAVQLVLTRVDRIAKAEGGEEGGGEGGEEGGERNAALEQRASHAKQWLREAVTAHRLQHQQLCGPSGA